MVCNIECTDEAEINEAISTREKKPHSRTRERRASGETKTRPRAVFQDGSLVISENSPEAKIRKRRAAVRWIKDAVDLYFMTPCMAIFLLVTIGLASYHTAKSNWVTRTETDATLARLEQLAMTLMFVLVALLVFTAYMFFWGVGAKFVTRRLKEGKTSCCCC